MSKFLRITELSMVDGSLRRYLGEAPQADYLAALNVHSYSASPETVAKFGLVAGKGQSVEPSITLAAVASGRSTHTTVKENSPPPSAAPQPEETIMSTAAAIRALAKIARTPGHPERASARRMILALPDDNEGKSARVGVEGATYLSPHARELDFKMGLGTEGRGVRVEGSQLILSATGRGQR